MMRKPKTDEKLSSRASRTIVIPRMSFHNFGTFTILIIFGISIFIPVICAQRKNGKNPIDLDDENDVGMSLTLPNSEDVVLVYDEDEVRTDEDEAESDDPEDLEDLENKRILPIEEDVVDRVSTPESGNLVNEIVSKSPMMHSRSIDDAFQVSSENHVSKTYDVWNIEEEEETVSSISAVATTRVSRKPPRVFTIPPSFRATFVPALEAINSPPVITKNPPQEIAYKIGSELTLECESMGDPEYVWKKNDQIVSENRSSGTLKYTAVNDSMDGVYQCFAANSFGTAVSTKSYVRKAELVSFPTKSVKVNEPREGQPLTLHCNPPRCHPKGFVYWSEEGVDQKLKAVENSDRISLDYDGNLHFANVIMADRRDDRKYVCVISNEVIRSNMQGDDQTIKPIAAAPGERLTPIAPKLVWSFPNESRLVIAKHKILRMKCIFSGYPTPVVTWERIGGNSGQHRMLFPNDSFGQEMIIKNVSTEDEGVYQCSASNFAAGSPTSKSFNVDVEMAPVWRNNEPPQDVEVSEDGDAVFKCLADGYPKPKILWSLNGVPVPELTNSARRQANATHLVFRNLTAADTQVVQCVAENVHGSLLANAYLLVKASAPELTVFFGPEVKVAEGKDLLLDCSATGFPSPVYHWTKNDTPIQASFDHFVLHSNGSLEIKDVMMSDDDVYKCSAQNKFGVHSTSGHLIVREKTMILITPQPQTALVQSEITLQCSAKTDPEEMDDLKVEWLKDDHPLNTAASSGRIYKTRDNSLVISAAQVADSGGYTCRAFTPLDSDEFFAQVIIKDRPDPPKNLLLTPCDGPNTTLSWQAGSDNNEKITQYILRYESSLNESGSFNISDIKSLQAVISLKPNRRYKFYVTAHNNLGASNQATNLAGECVTPPSTPSKNPEGVCSEMRGLKRLVIMWQPLTIYELNGEGFRYIVSYKRLDHPDGKENRLAMTDWRSRELVFYDLEEFIPFEISVQSVNNVGQVPGEVEHRIVRTSEGTPTISPQNFRINVEKLNSSSVEFQWDAIDTKSELIKGFFRGYEVQFWKSGEPDTKRAINVRVDTVYDFCPLVTNRNRRDASTRTMVSAVATGLWPFSHITAGVAVLNGAKVGNLSNTITFQTPEGVPGAVTHLRMIEVGSFHLRLRWSPPLDPNGIITGYVIRYIVEDSLNESALFNNITDPLKTYVKLHPLQSDSLYHISVFGRTSVGLGEPAHLQIRTLVSQPPDKPLIIHSEVAETSVNISWLPSESKPVNPGSEFYLEFRKIDDNIDGWQTAYPDEEDDRWVNATDLETGIEYEFVVVAVNLVNITKSNRVVYKIGEQQTSSPMVYSTAQSSWFIAVMIIVAVIILIIVIVCIVCQRNKGGRYPVVKKEQQFGKAVTEEEKGFGEYVRRPEPNHIQSRSSLISQSSNEFSDDDISLGEYGDPDTAKFTEDGSFIGRYTTKTNHDSTLNRHANSHNTSV